MGDKTKIEWANATWNPIRGCSRVSEGCRNCYAERVAARFSGKGKPYEGLAEFRHMGDPDRRQGQWSREPRWTGEVRLIEAALDLPLRWLWPRRIFVNSMSDLFHEKVSFDWLDRIFSIMQASPQHIFQVLTKRSERMKLYMNGVGTEIRVSRLCQELAAEKGWCDAHDDRDWPLPNVWIGVSVEDQKTADERIPLLLSTPAAVRWVSYEPALGPVDFRPWLTVTKQRDRMLDWIVCGGESGPGARPMHPDWARSARDQCQTARTGLPGPRQGEPGRSVPFFFKQWGGRLHTSEMEETISAEDRDRKTWKGNRDPSGLMYFRVGKKAAGRMLDGREWNEYPQTKTEGR